MVCVAKNCTVTNIYDGCFLTCWLCDGHAHVKCAGFNGRHFDKIASKESGLRWSCWDCRQFDVDFYRLFKEAKNGFSALNNDLSSLMSKFKVMEEMFNKFMWPENLLSSPRRKKASGDRNSDNLQSDIPLTPNFDHLGRLFVSPLPSSVAVSVTSLPNTAPTVDSIRECLDVVPNNVSSHVSVTPATPNSISVVSELNKGIPEIDISLERGQVSALPTVSKGTVSSAPSTRPLESTPVSGDLVVVPPRKTIFISRLSSDTSIENIVNYVKLNFSEFNDNDCRILKFNYSGPRDISSFRIIVPVKVFGVLSEQSFWPDGVLVKEFIPRNKPRRVGPVDLQRSKN